MPAEIERLSIGIDATVKGSPDKVDRLALSLEKLQTVLDRGLSNLSNIISQLSGLSTLSSLKDSGKGIDRLTLSLTKLQSVSFAGFGSKMSALSSGLEPLRDLQIGGIADFGKGLNFLANGLNKLQSIDIASLATNITGVVNAIRPLTDEMLRGGNQASAYGQAMLMLARASKTTATQAKKAAPRMNSLTTSLVKFASFTFLFRRAVRFGSEMISETANWTENLNLFIVSFGTANYEAALDWTIELAQNFGYATNELVKFTATFKQLGDSLGIANETSTMLSQTLTQLALDFSSLYNIQTQRAFETFQSAIFGGQTKGARLLFGVEVAYQSLDQTLKNLAGTYEELAGVTARQLTQAQKAELRSLEFLRAGQSAMGDMARNINSLQNQLRVFQGSISNLKLAFGDLLLNEPFQAILTTVNGLLIGITGVVRAFAPLRRTIENLPENNLVSGINDELDEMNSKLGLLSFDVFNVLQTGGAENENLAITAALTAELEKQSALYQEIFDTQMAGIENRAISIGKKIRDWFIIVDENGAFVEWTNNIKPLIPIFETLFKIGEAYWNVIKQIAPILVDILKGISSIVLWLDDIGALEPIIWGIVIAMTAYKIATIAAGIASITAFGWIIIAIAAVVAIIALLVKNWDSVVKFFKSTLKAIGGFFVDLWNNVKTVAVGIGNAFISAINIVLVVFETIINAIIEGLNYVIKGLNVIPGVNIRVIGHVQWQIPPIQGFANGGIPGASQGTAFVMDEYGKPELMYENSAGQVEISNQTSLETSFFNALIRYHSMTADERQKLIVEIRDRTTGGTFEQIYAPRIISEAQRQRLI